jgi:hypothetical protein
VLGPYLSTVRGTGNPGSHAAPFPRNLVDNHHSATATDREAHESGTPAHLDLGVSTRCPATRA